MRKTSIRRGLFFSLAVAFNAARAGDFEIISQFPQTSASSAGIATGPELSADAGFILFQSTAPDLAAPARDSRFFNVFLHHRASGATRLASVNATADGGANAHVMNPSVSDDGRFVVFESKASNLSATARYGKSEIFLRDLQENSTLHLSAPRPGFPQSARADSTSPTISPDGQLVAFSSNSRDLPSPPIGTAALFYLFERSQMAIRPISSQNLGAAANTVRTFNPHFARNGDTVLFEATGTNVVTRGDTYGRHIFGRHLSSGETFWVSARVMAILNRAANTRGDSQIRGLSDDGRTVLFVTTDVPATAGANVTNYLFLDNVTAQSTRILATNMVTASHSLALTPSGRYAAFSVGGNVWRYDTQSEASELVSARLDGTALPSGPNPTQITMTADGRYVTFLSDAAGLTSESQAGVSRLYRRDMLTSETASITPALAGEVYETSTSLDGAQIVFMSDDPAIVPNDLNGAPDVFIWDSTVDAVTPFSIVSRPAPNANTAGAFRMLSVSDKPGSADGKMVAFSAIPNGAFGSPQIFVRDRAAQTTALISRNSTDGGPASGSSSKAMVSADGRWIAYETLATNLVAGINDTNNATDVILFDRQTQTSRQVTRTALGDGTAQYASSLEAMSPNGRYLLVSTYNNTFVNPPVPRIGIAFTTAIYLWDRETGAFTLLTRNSAGSAIHGSHYGFQFSPDSQRAAFVGIGTLQFEQAYTGRATNHISNTAAALLVLETESRRLRGIPATTVIGPQRAVTFSPEGSKLVTTALPSNTSRSISVIDMQTWAITDFAFPELRPTQVSAAFDAAAVAYRLVTATSGALGLLNIGAMTTNRISFANDTLAEDIAITPNGASLIFQTPAATALDNNTFPDLYVTAAPALETTLLTKSAFSDFAANGPSVARRVSPDGTTLFFVSGASDLIGTDLNGAADLCAINIATPLPGAPIIARGPSPQIVFPGETAIFHVVAAPSAEPITYQWFRGPTAIDGATAATLVIPNASENDSGMIRVELRNASGSAISEDVALEVSRPALQYELTAPDTIVLSWRAPSGGYRVELATFLGPNPNWSVQQNQGLLNNGRFTATFSLLGSQIYFRMRKD